MKPFSERKKFKVGDRVRRITDSYNGLNVGQIYTVAGLHNNGVLIEEGEKGFGYAPSYFELVSENESELQRLVRVANEGSKAAEILHDKYAEQVERKREDYPFTLFSKLKAERGFLRGIEYRVKAAPAFEPFVLADSSHKVVLSADGKQISVGCVTFDPPELAEALGRFLKDNAVTQYSGLTPSRRGLEHPRGYMSWADADLLLSKLEKLSSGGRK